MEESSGIFIPMVSGPGEKSGSEVCWEAHLTGCLRTPACNRAILRRAAAATCGDHLPVCLEPRGFLSLARKQSPKTPDPLGFLSGCIHCTCPQLPLSPHLLDDGVGVFFLTLLQSTFLHELFPALSRPPGTLPSLSPNLRTFA